MLERLLEPGPRVQEGYPRPSLTGWGLLSLGHVCQSSALLWETATLLHDPLDLRSELPIRCLSGYRLQVLRHREYGSNVLM